MGALLRCEVVSDPGQGRTDGGRRLYRDSYSEAVTWRDRRRSSDSSLPKRARRKPRIAPKCRKLLSKCMSGGTAKGRKARAGKCMRKFQKCRRKG